MTGDTSENEIYLERNVPTFESNTTFGVVSIDRSPGHPLTVKLAIRADGEQDFLLQIGDTFTVLDRAWRLDRVENAESSNWLVVLVRVDPAG